MKILFITPSVPSRLHRIRAYTLIKALSKNHEIILISLSTNKTETVPQEIQDMCIHHEIIYKNKWKALLDCILYFWYPSEVGYCHSTTMKNRVQELVKQYAIDLVYIKRLRCAQYAHNIKVPKILDTTDAMSLFYKRMVLDGPYLKKFFYIVEWLRYCVYENIFSCRYHHWVSCSEHDIDYLKKRYSTVTFTLIPNTVDTDFFKPLESKNIREHSIVISGLMDKFVNYEAAIYFVEKIFPSIQKKYPHTHLYIVGPKPIKKIRRYQNHSITVTGKVNDIRDYIALAQVIVCPIHTGTGTRNKILQAWAMSKPVVSTSAGAEGLDAYNEKNILIADSVDQWIKAIDTVFMNQNIMKALGREGLATVQLYYDEKRLHTILDTTLQSMV